MLIHNYLNNFAVEKTQLLVKETQHLGQETPTSSQENPTFGQRNPTPGQENPTRSKKPNFFEIAMNLSTFYTKLRFFTS